MNIYKTLPIISSNTIHFSINTNLTLQMYTDPRYTDDIYSQGSYDDVLNQFPNSEPKDPFSKSSYDPYDDYYTVSDKEYEDRIGSVTVDIERETGSFRKKKGSRCAGFRILPSCILLICISWLRYCTLALHTAWATTMIKIKFVYYMHFYFYYYVL